MSKGNEDDGGKAVLRNWRRKEKREKRKEKREEIERWKEEQGI